MEPSAAMRIATGAPTNTPSKKATATTTVPTMPDRPADVSGAGSGEPIRSCYRQKDVGSREDEMPSGVHHLPQAEPGREVVELRPDVLRDRLREPHVLVDRVHSEDAGVTVGEGIDLPDEPVVVENRQREVAPAPLRRRLVHLERVLEVEQLLRTRPVVDEPVER